MATPPIPREALDYFRRKKLRVGFDFRDVWREEHATQFTVAKITELDVLQAVFDSLTQNLEQGETFETWRKDIRGQLAKRGWWGAREVVDPATGEIGKTDLSAPARLRTIYDTNLRNARAAGQWERIQRTKQVLPYLVYELGPSVHHRAEHVAWHGVVLLADDPWWRTHYAPNGYGCKCRIRQAGPSEYARLLRDGVPAPGTPIIDPATGLPTGRTTRAFFIAQTTAPKIDVRPVRNRRTGEVDLVPKGIDPGFNYNPGIARAESLKRLAEAKSATLRS